LKFAFSVCTVLTFVLTVLVVFQYDAFSVEKTEEPHFTYNQEIDVKVDGGKLLVNHHFTGLPEHSISIVWPSESGQAGCEEGKMCDRLSPDLSILSEGESGELNLSYEVPIDSNSGQTILLTAPFVLLQEGELEHSILHLTDRSKMGGTWLSGLPLIGKQTMSTIDYSLFAGSGAISELYWQKEPLSMAFKNDYFSLYSDGEPSKKLKKMLESVSFPDHVDMIVGEKRLDTSRIVFIRQTGEQEMERVLAIATIQSSFVLSKEDGILLSVLANLITGQNEGNSRAKAISTAMRTLPADQVEQFISKLWKIEKGSALNGNVLDSLLGDVLQGSVSFFERNNGNAPFFPLVKEDNRKILVDGEVKKVDVIFQDNRTLFSLKPIIDHLGYTMREGDHGLYLDNGMRSFRFPVDEPFYVLNERRYEAPTKPIVSIGGTYYIEEKWLILLFLVNVDKAEEQIRIDRMEGF